MRQIGFGDLGNAISKVVEANEESSSDVEGSPAKEQSNDHTSEHDRSNDQSIGESSRNSASQD